MDKVQGPLLLRCMLPGLLMTVGSSDISPKGYGVIREHALHFIKHLMAHVSIRSIGGGHPSRGGGSIYQEGGGQKIGKGGLFRGAEGGAKNFEHFFRNLKIFEHFFRNFWEIC